ncbi:MAG: hypothetical protein KY445_04925 [Armatimonadetes bacterium]|nr:hypothetical protein [Armatimonadota bacterium]
MMNPKDLETESLEQSASARIFGHGSAGKIKGIYVSGTRDLLAVPLVPGIPQTSSTAQFSLDAMLSKLSAMKADMIAHQSESAVLGKRTDENLAKMRAMLSQS